MFWLIVAIIVWGAIHSITASIAFKESMRRMFGDGFMRLYRLLYNVFAFVSFLPVLYIVGKAPGSELYKVPAPWSGLMLVGQGIAALLLAVAVLQTDTLSFIGLRQVFEEEKPSPLITKGLYKIVRHPLYTFSLLFLWLSPTVHWNSFVFYIALTGYIFVGAYFEEKKLLREFGQEYTDYRSATPMIVPGLKFKGNK